jgi:hypothetical protein
LNIKQIDVIILYMPSVERKPQTQLDAGSYILGKRLRNSMPGESYFEESLRLFDLAKQFADTDQSAWDYERERAVKTLYSGFNGDIKNQIKARNTTLAQLKFMDRFVTLKIFEVFDQKAGQRMNYLRADRSPHIISGIFVGLELIETKDAIITPTPLAPLQTLMICAEITQPPEVGPSYHVPLRELKRTARYIS